MFEYLLHPKFQLKDFRVLSPHLWIPPSAPICSDQWNIPLRLRNIHFSSRCFNCMQAPSLTINTDDWRKALLFRVKVKFRFFFLVSFHFGLISFYSVLSFDRKMKQKEKEVYTHFILSYSLYEHQTRVFYLILWVDTFLVSWNIISINPCLQTPWNIYWIIQYRF